MKKLSYAIILASSLIFIIPFLFYFSTTDTGKENMRANLLSDTPMVYEKELKNVSETPTPKEYVSNSAIKGYMIQSENDNVYLYEIYENGYKEKIRPLVREAELYHILPRPDGVNWDGIMYADPDSANEIKGVVFLFKPSADVENVKNIVFDGLDESTVYQLTFEDRPEQNCTATGADLMTKGIDVEIKYVGSEIIWITKAE